MISTTGDYYEDYGNYPNISEDTAPCRLDAVGEFGRYFVPPVFTLVFVVGLAGNGLVLVVLGRRRCPWHLADRYLFQLALADILLVLGLPFWATQFAHGWVFGEVLCKLVGALSAVNSYSSILLLAGISIDRYLAIVHAVQLYRRLRALHLHLACALLWAICLALSVPELHFRTVPFQPQGQASICHRGFKAHEAQAWRVVLHLTSFFLGFLLPLLVMLFCYGRIFCTLHRAQLPARPRSLRLVLLLLAVFVLCWAPFYVFLLLDCLQRLGYIGRHCALERVLDFGLLVTEGLGLLHCCLNPLVYAFAGIKFRRELSKLCWNGQRHRQSSSQRQILSTREQSHHRGETSVHSTPEGDTDHGYSVML
ncbi:C-X-C chemokine receptor type 3-2-like [Malaclemys terrapin pileata]|uniref:C-X-C chemokine receptor type 3-2-like n=1 Tax=Malaclemys terrapin pileata TaxID=2991368 RepID=UPI0023A80AA7|nr:C-X-C chemokine receptor type 3-2-like [Malaclemys terrapin pileata]